MSGDKRRPQIRLAAGIDALDVELGFAANMDERTFFGWDDERDDLVVRVERRLGSLDFGTHVARVEPSPETTQALIDRIVETDLGALKWTEAARQFQARVALITEHRPDEIDAKLNDEWLRNNASEVFGGFLHGASGRKDIEAMEVLEVLRSQLSWDEQQTVNRLTPQSYTFARGRERRIDYTAETLKVSVRAQDAYGTATTPAVIDGAVPIAVELLSPADRPIQITSDLAGFWTGSWASVRKDMAGRYPKHDWPEDPC